MKEFLVYIKADGDAGYSTVIIKADECTVGNAAVVFKVKNEIVAYFTPLQLVGYAERERTTD